MIHFIPMHKCIIMSDRITKIENFPYQNIVTLNQSVTDKRYLIFDLWSDPANPSAQTRYKQIFLQINDLKILCIKEGQIYFDLTKRRDVIDSMYSIEEHIFLLLKR